MDVVTYCRVSTQNQKIEGTVNMQVELIKEYCINNNLNLIKIFKDEAISGGLENRPALSELFSFLEANKHVKKVVIWKLDRLARDLYLQEHLILKFEQLDVSLISTKEPNLDSSDPMRKAFRQFMGIVSELEKSFITMRLSAGRINKARKGEYSGGRPAYGYLVNNGKMVINKSEADIVKQVYKMRRYKKMSLGRIAHILNKNGIKSANNRLWYPATIKYLLKNKLYKGNISYKGLTSHITELAIITS